MSLSPSFDALRTQSSGWSPRPANVVVPERRCDQRLLRSATLDGDTSYAVPWKFTKARLPVEMRPVENAWPPPEMLTSQERLGMVF